MPGVKIETDDEKLAGRAEVIARLELLSAAINGNSREKTRMAHQQRNFFMARGRDDAITTGISRCRLTGKRRGQV